MSAVEPTRRVWVEEIMGIPMSVHLRSSGVAPDPESDRAVSACFAELREVDRVFSTYRPHSDISRIGRGELDIADADPAVALVDADCRRIEADTDGLFSARWNGAFDPTGYVKGWGVERAARRHLAPLLEHHLAVGINAGGDLQLFTAAGADWRWRVGIADPHRRGRIIATVDVADGAVATSGTAERGHHIIDPRTGEPAASVVSATVVADGLTRADVWATAATVAAFDDRSWLARAGTRSGMRISADGRVSRWLGATAVDVVAAGAEVIALAAA